ncbi:hypothetical protein [Vibrio cholerae]|uniref:hypothetical protein n=1 Tax=Vibrio cholerae TaxID=666 RepID=UPI00155DEFED|nr:MULTISPECIES: hypothetical protein [Vibrio]ELI1915025.1 hypothetical protein [Vibrio cholerae]ELJ8681828.1 hypothetical protein [Vibrio cholerae]ELY5265539.1 hypothetical protein [Vibrio cholerae]MCX9475958.1 hypothetical protein [Vibrio cholerae]MCX9479499.1 hypothetical protein [Vibrio cholerae]
MRTKHTTAMPTGKDSHSLVNEATLMLNGLADLASGHEGQIEQLSGESLHFLLKAVSEKLSLAMYQMEHGA